eukprot:CAMPEP_0167740898 /NCGR_PEP_ID=MMETSP0110_2-20121227/549_1 /TAXON_ID=629695 /ORGANISM="Gymnochlora sp., Strain CCMP2014" /LENGTH=333 /DNA_ID=CAMNT_0007624875 /DNA_START=349 /DNA_END=1351 /DNA_ORIENTATION=-
MRERISLFRGGSYLDDADRKPTVTITNLPPPKETEESQTIPQVKNEGILTLNVTKDLKAKMISPENLVKMLKKEYFPEEDPVKRDMFWDSNMYDDVIHQEKEIQKGKQMPLGADYVICAAAAGVSELQPQANPVEVADSILFGGFEKVDNRGVANVAAVAAGLDIPPKRIILVSSLGVTRFPVVQLASLAGDVLAQKRKGEMALITSGLPYTIVRPGRLQGDGGPEQPESVKQEKLRLGQGDIMSPGRISRMDVAKACVEILKRPSAATDSTFEIVGDASDMTSDKWDEVFASLKTDSEYKSPIEEVLGFDPFEPSSVLKRIVEILPPPPSSP